MTASSESEPGDAESHLPATLSGISYSQSVARRRRAADRFRLFRRHWVELLATHRGVLSGSLSLTGIAGVALAGLVLEGLLAGNDVEWLTLVLLAVSLGLGLLLLGTRNAITHKRGTLYYVRLLQQSMTDTHGLGLTRRRKGYAETRSITRWIDPRRSVGSVSDLSPQVVQVAAELERCMNDDTSASGFHLAPNMLWPAALAVGYNLFWRDEIDLVDLPAGLPSTPPKVDGRTHLDRGQKQDIDDTVVWRLDDEGEQDQVFSEPAWIVSPRGPGTVESVLISISLTDGTAPDQPRWPADVTYRVGVFETASAQSRLDRGLVVGNRMVEIDIDPTAAVRRAFRRAVTSADALGRPRPLFEVLRSDLRVVHPHRAARICVEVIRHALHEHPDARVMLACRIPKTVGLAVGALLARDGKGRSGNPGCGHERCPNQSCRDPWSRLVPLLFTEDRSEPYVITRVHESQPSVFALSARFPRTA